MTKILLINPPFNRLKGRGTRYFPLGLGYLAAVLRDAGFETRIWNAELAKESVLETPMVRYVDAFRQHALYGDALANPEHPAWRDASGILKDFDPDIVGITTMRSKYPSAMKLAALAKEGRRDRVVITGGIHPTVMPKEMLRNDTVDFAVQGEGEWTIVALCDAIRSGKRQFAAIPGLYFRDIATGQIVDTGRPPLIANLDGIPFPARELILDKALYHADLMGAMIVSRGCPFLCGFCEARNLWTRKVRFRSAKNVADEMEHVVMTYGSRHFDFWDDSFTVDKRRTGELCDEIIARKFDVTWYCSTRADLVDEGLLRLMRKAGCTTIALGLESGSPRMLEQLKKGVTLTQVQRAIQMVQRNGISATAFVMLGFPDEHEEEIQQTIAFVKKLDVDLVRFTVFTPYPGSEQFEAAKEMGLIPEEIDWTKFDHQSPENHFVKNVSKERFRSLVNTMTDVVDHHNYSRTRRIRRAWRELCYRIRESVA